MRYLLILVAIMVLALPGMARADDNRPLSVSVAQEAAEAFRVAWKIPANVEARNMPALSAQGCAVRGNARNWSDVMGTWREERWTCPDGLASRTIAIDYPLANPGLATIVRYLPLGEAEPRTVLLQPQDSSFVLAQDGDPQGGFVDFVILGVEHIWLGFDHLLFVAGLIFIAGTPRRILTTITGFTLAHSITLALSTLDIIRLPIAAVEAVIALSIVFLAVEIVKGRRDTLTWRRPVLVAGSFGLLHGFGFAAVLREIGLPEDGFIAALLAFNIGIEIGQVIFAGLVMALSWLAARLARRMERELPTAKPAGYGVGCLASYWMFERLAG